MLRKAKVCLSRKRLFFFFFLFFFFSGWLTLLSFLQSNSALAKSDSATPETSRKVFRFSKWLTQGDQVELVQKDMESAQRFGVRRKKLSGLEMEPGKLVVGVTAITFLNPDGQICFVHPYQIIGQYCKNDKGQLEYALSAKYKNVKYMFEMDAGLDAAVVVAEIDRRSLRLEKSIAANNGSLKTTSGGVPPKSPRGGGGGGGGAQHAAVPMFDSELEQPKPKTKVSQVVGSRFRVKMMFDDGSEHKAVAIVSHESITLVDPTTSAGDNPNTVFYRAVKWPGVTSITSSKDEVKIASRDGVIITLIVQDAHAFVAEINRKREEAEVMKQQAAAGGGGNDDEECEVMKW